MRREDPLMTFLSIDLETLSTKPDATVLSVGLCFKYHANLETEDYHFVLPAQPQIELLGRHVDVRTIGWWMQQSEEARASIRGAFLPADVDALTSTARQIANCIERRTPDEVWGYAASFDCAILENLFDNLDIPCPWTYKQVRCLRTAAALFPDAKPEQRTGDEHNALYDAIYQAEWIANIKTRMKNGG